MANPLWVKGMTKGAHGQGPGGRNPGTSRKLRRLEEHVAEIEVMLGRQADPVVTLLELAAGHDAYEEQRVKGLIERGVLKPDDERDAKIIANASRVDQDVRVDAAKAAARYFRPALAQTTLTGPDGGPLSIAAAQFPVKDLMTNDEIAGFVENLQIALAKKASESQQDQAQEQTDGGTT